MPGEFTASAFVSRTVGVDNVCERAAVAAADGGSLLIHKQAMDGVTIAVAKRGENRIAVCVKRKEGERNETPDLCGRYGTKDRKI